MTFQQFRGFSGGSGQNPNAKAKQGCPQIQLKSRKPNETDEGPGILKRGEAKPRLWLGSPETEPKLTDPSKTPWSQSQKRGGGTPKSGWLLLGPFAGPQTMIPGRIIIIHDFYTRRGFYRSIATPIWKEQAFQHKSAFKRRAHATNNLVGRGRQPTFPMLDSGWATNTLAYLNRT